MVAAIEKFHAELYEQHIEEAFFLYEQRLAFDDDPEVSWREVDDFESRFEAHIDALVVGAEPALEICKQRFQSGDFGEVHAALRVFCRQDRADLALAGLQTLDLEDPECTGAAIDALKAECPESWYDDLIRVMLGRNPELAPVLAAVLAYRRAPIEDTLLRVLPAAPPAGIGHGLRALGRIGSDSSKRLLGTYLQSEDEALAGAACRALVRLGDYQAVRHGLLVAQMKSWPLLTLGIGGDHSAVNVLTDIVQSDAVSDDALLALGLLGHLGSIKTIFDCLQGDCAAAAALALQTITGARLVEQVFVPDPVDPDEFFDDERIEYERTGKVPAGPDGQPFGTTVEQISINPGRWRSWFAANKNGFDPKLRYRHGKPYSPAALIDCLADEYTPFRIRELILDELVTRYQAPVALEADMPVAEQLRHIDSLLRWAGDNRSRFVPGRWYFAGQPMDGQSAT